MLQKLLKHIKILLFILSLFLIACSEKPPEIDAKCHEDSDCFDQGEVPSKVCIDRNCTHSPCIDPSICGDGVCLMKGISPYHILDNYNYYCFCYISTDEKKYYRDENINYCYSEDNFECNSHSDCYNITISTDNWSDYNRTQYCTKDHKCVEYCESDSDCIGEGGYCINNHCETDVDCSPSYKYLYNGECQPPCQTDYDCKKESICSHNKRCISPCESDQDCIDNNWSVGSICNLPTNTCIKENYSTPFEILNYYINEIGFECNIDSFNSYFMINCDNNYVEYQNNMELNVDQIIIESTNHNSQSQTLTESEMLDLIIEAKNRSFFTLGEAVPNGTFKYNPDDAYVFNSMGEPCVEGGEARGISIMIPRVHNGLTIVGEEALFRYNLDLELYRFRVGVINIPPTPEDDQFIDQIYQKGRDITNLIKENRDYNYKVYTTPVYYYENSELILGYVIEVDNLLYKFYDSEYDGTYQSIEPIFE